MSNTLLLRRGTRSALTSLVSSSGLTPYEPLFVTNEGRLSVATATNAEVTLARLDDVSTLGRTGEWSDIANKPSSFPPSAHGHPISDVTNLQTTLNAKAPLASPALTGTPTAPTATAGTNTTQIATTAFVQTALGSKQTKLEDVSSIELGVNVSSPAPAYIDFHTIGTPASDQEARIIRDPGANGEFTFTNTGTGKIKINATSGVDIGGAGLWSTGPIYSNGDKPVWHSGNFNPSSYLTTGSGQQVTGAKSFVSTGPIGAASGSVGTNIALSSGAENAAFITFHRSGSFACHFGLDTDNKLKVGGWSMGNNAYEIWHANNFNPANYLPLAGGTLGANAVVQFGNEATDKIRYYGNTYGVGIESSTLTHWSASNFRWRTDSTSVSTGTTRMELSPTALSVTGNITATGDVGAYSDEQLKSNIETIGSALDKVSNLRGVYYTKDDKRGVGVIAQEVQKVIPEVVGKSGEYLTVSYGNLVGVLIEAIKELKAEVETLKRSK